MKLAFVFTLTVALFLIPTSTWAGSISVVMTADRTQISAEESLEVQVAVIGTQDQANPEILNAKDFDVQSSGTSTQVQIINGQMSQQVAYAFALTPQTPGRFKIGPAQVVLSGKTYQSAQIDVEVVKGSSSTAGHEKYFYVVGELSNKAPYVNQQVDYIFKFFNRAELANAQIGLPEFKGFLKEGPDKQQESEQIVNGIRWHVTSLHFALFPTTPGPIEIEPSRLTADAVMRNRNRDSFFDDFFGNARTKRVTLRSEPIQLNVKALPSEGRPSNFSGLVGEFTLSNQLSKSVLPVGDSSTLTVTLQGNGNLRGFNIPEINSQDLKSYDDQPAFDLTPSAHQWTGTKTFKRALVPLRSGEIKVPVIEVSYFDPTQRVYKKLETQKVAIKATGAAPGDDSIHHVAGSQESTTKKGIDVLGKDLISIKRSPTALRRDSLTDRESKTLFAICTCCPFLYLLAFWFVRRKNKFANNTSLLRRKRAFRDFSEGLRRIKNNGAFLLEGSLLLREYLGNKFNLDGKAITPLDAARKLAPYGLSNSSIKNIEDFLRECEAAQFGGLTGNSSADQQEKLSTIVQSVEREAAK